MQGREGKREGGEKEPKGKGNQEKVGTKDTSVVDMIKMKAEWLNAKKSVIPGQLCRQTCVNSGGDIISIKRNHSLRH